MAVYRLSGICTSESESEEWAEQRGGDSQSSLITHLFGTNSCIKKAQETQEKDTVRNAAKSTRRKRKLEFSEEYQPGN